MYAARGPARPQAGHGAAHNRTRTPSRGVTLPRRPDYRRAVTRVKDACGAGQAGRAEARSLTWASRAHEQAAARERDTRGQFTMPCNRSAGAKLQAEPRLTQDRSFRDVRSPGTFSVRGCPTVTDGLDGDLARLQDRGTGGMAPIAMSPASAGFIVPS